MQRQAISIKPVIKNQDEGQASGGPSERPLDRFGAAARKNDMPFDGTSFSPRPEKPARPALCDNAVSILIIAISFSLLVMPLSMAGLVDLAWYLRGH